MFNLFCKTILAASALAVVLATHTVAFAAETETAEESFTIVLLPDTQNYSEKYPET